MRWQYNDGGRKEAGYRGNTGDCVCRAIAIATQKPYEEVYGLINSYAQRERRRDRKHSSAREGVYKATIKRVMAALGWKWVPTMQIGGGCRVHLADGELPMGRLVVSVSKHLVAVIDGVINDTHDCSRSGSRCVYGYYRAGNGGNSVKSPIKTPSNGEQAPTAPSIPPKRNARKTALTARYTREGFLVMSAGRILRQAESMIPMEMRPYYIGGMVKKDYAGPMTADNCDITLQFTKPVGSFGCRREIRANLVNMQYMVGDLFMAEDLGDGEFDEYDEEVEGRKPARIAHTQWNSEKAKDWRK